MQSLSSTLGSSADVTPGLLCPAYSVESIMRLLDRAALSRGYPPTLPTKKGQKFISRTFMALEQNHGIHHILI